jgi:RnfABCDGE-type electron transport complex G subunit
MKGKARYFGVLSITAVTLVVLALTTACDSERSGEVPPTGTSPEPQAVSADGVQTAEAAASGREPWPYVELDPEEVRKRGHAGHHDGSCGYGSFNAIIGLLQEEIGSPYDQIPTYMLHFGRGGVSGSGSACGTVLGSSAAINLIAGEDYRPLAAELVEYYETTEFPTDSSNRYAVNHEFPGEDYIDEALPQSVAGSINCDESRGAWVQLSGYDMSSEERHERCARLTGDVAAKAVMILNEWHSGKLVDVADPKAELGNLFPGATFEQLEGHLHRVKENGEPVGYADIDAAPGYQGNIVVAVGINLNGRVEGVHVVRHNETQGLGSKIAEEEFLSQFEGLTPEQIRLRSDDGRIDAVSGATDSSETVTQIVREQVEALKEHLD